MAASQASSGPFPSTPPSPPNQPAPADNDPSLGRDSMHQGYQPDRVDSPPRARFLFERVHGGDLDQMVVADLTGNEAWAPIVLAFTPLAACFGVLLWATLLFPSTRT